MSKHGENIWKRKDGRWEARYVKGRTSDGKAIYGSVYAKSYSEVKQKQKEAIDWQAQTNYSMPFSPRTLESVIKEFLTEHKFNIKTSTYARYIEITDKHLIPDLGSIRISDFNQDIGNNYVKRLLIDGKCEGVGLAPKTVKDIISVLKLVLKYAEEKKYRSPAPIVFSVPKADHSQIQIFSQSQIECLEALVCSTSDTYKFGVYLCMYTGLRLGEICALQWKDIDCINSTLSVNKTILRVKNVSSTAQKKTELLINSPKTPSSKRLIPLPRSLSRMLKNLKEEYSPSENAYVLTGSSNFIEPRNYYRRYKCYLRLCNLENFNFHALRHTFATRCIEAGVDAKVLSEILGHASVKITLDRYVHPSLEAKRNSMERLFRNGSW